MKIAIITLTAALMISSIAFAHESKSSSASDTSVKEMTGTEKKSKKKKGEMCTECGKSDKACECHNKKGEEKKSDKPAETK